jgi:ABC-type multidrug transport system fused ATPase/permease subunit
VRSDVAQLATSSPGEMLSRIQRDTSDLQHVLTRDLPQLLTGAIETVIGFVILFRICPSLARWVTVAVPLSVAGAALYGQISAKYSRALNAELAASSDVANEQLTGIRVVKSFAGEGVSERKYSSIVRRVLRHGNKVAVADGFMQAWNRAIFGMKNVLILWAGSKFVALGSLSIGSLLAFAFYTGNLSAALSRLGVRLTIVLSAIFILHPVSFAHAGPPPLNFHLRPVSVWVLTGVVLTGITACFSHLQSRLAEAKLSDVADRYPALFRSLAPHPALSRKDQLAKAMAKMAGSQNAMSILREASRSRMFRLRTRRASTFPRCGMSASACLLELLLPL